MAMPASAQGMSCSTLMVHGEPASHLDPASLSRRRSLSLLDLIFFLASRCWCSHKHERTGTFEPHDISLHLDKNCMILPGNFSWTKEMITLKALKSLKTANLAFKSTKPSSHITLQAWNAAGELLTELVKHLHRGNGLHKGHRYRKPSMDIVLA